MAAPPKPWEIVPPANNMLNRNIPGMASNSFIGSTSPQDQLLGGGVGLSGGGLGNRVSPPLPPRPQQQQSVNNSYSRYGGGYSSFGSGYSSLYSSSPYSSYYSPYSGSFGSGYGGYGGYNRPGYFGSDGYQGMPDEESFMQMAENSSRPAFQSIESIVHAVGSVSMMLESTFHAVYSSFRAVIGVADHFTRMKTHLGQIFSMLALLRALRWLFRRALHLLGLSQHDPRSEGAWAAAAAADADRSGSAFLSENDIKQNKLNWPILLYLGMVFGTPWLIWKLLASVPQSNEKAPSDWATGKVDHFVATASFDFTSESEQEVSFRAGQEITLAPKELQPRVRGWLLGSIDGKKTGLVPANYIQIHGKRKGFGNNPTSSLAPVTERLESSFAQAVSASNAV